MPGKSGSLTVGFHNQKEGSVKMFLFVLLMLFLLAGPAWAAGADEGDILTEVNLKTFAGVVLAAWILTEIAGGLLTIGTRVKQIISIVATLTIGISAKKFGIGFAEIHWLTFILTLAIGAGGGQVANDKIFKPLGLQWKNREARNRLKLPPT